MPYILPTRRERLDNEIEMLLDKLEDINAASGDYNYVITRLLLGYIELHGKRYEHFNTVDGILGCVQKEFYRRWTSGYEDSAIKRNGDVATDFFNEGGAYEQSQKRR